jgi:pyridoxal phosphate enzyme (YggS family)
MVNLQAWQQLKTAFEAKGVTLIAVSKIKPASDIQALYDAGQRDFGENYVQELVEKEDILPEDIRWHFIGHLQSNKVKYIAPFIHLIHAVDNYKLLQEINKQALKNNRIIDVLLQMHIANEETKFGMDEQEITEVIRQFNEEKLVNVRVCGLMGMATFTDNMQQVKDELTQLHTCFKRLATTSFSSNPEFKICSMGMSADYEIAIEAGSTMVRIGSLLFGSR